MGQRVVSTVAPQALFFLNHPFVVDQARTAAERTLALPENERLVTRISPHARARAFIGGTREMRALPRLEALRQSLEDWAQIQQTLFGCIDFRYLE